MGGGAWIISDFRCFLQVSEAILDNARLMLQTENIQANAEDFKERLASKHSPVTHVRAPAEACACSFP